MSFQIYLVVIFLRLSSRRRSINFFFFRIALENLIFKKQMVSLPLGLTRTRNASASWIASQCIYYTELHRIYHICIFSYDLSILGNSWCICCRKMAMAVIIRFISFHSLCGSALICMRRFCIGLIEKGESCYNMQKHFRIWPAERLISSPIHQKENALVRIRDGLVFRRFWLFWHHRFCFIQPIQVGIHTLSRIPSSWKRA